MKKSIVFSAQAGTGIYGALLNSVRQQLLDFYATKNVKIPKFRVWGCYIEVLKESYKTRIEDRTEFGYYMEITYTRGVIQY